jgi:filamentous hemagglutinin
MSFNSASGYIVLGDYGKANAALPSGKVTVLDHSDVVQEDGQKVAVCVFGVCVNVPNIPAVTPKVPSQNPQTPTNSPQQPANPDQQNPVTPDNAKPTTDLTGTWVENGSTVTIDSRGCTAAYSGNLSVGGQNPQHRVFTLKQSGNQLTFSDATVTTTFGSGGSGTQSYQGNISGNKITYIVSGNAGGGFKVESTGNISEDGNTVTFEGTCTGSRGSATANATFTWTREVSLGQCPRFQTMLSEAQHIRELADTLEKDNNAYNAAVIDIVQRGYNSPYAVYMLDVPSEEIWELFTKNRQGSAVRSQLIEHIRNKADNREKFAKIGISGEFMPQTPIYSKENIELFCSLDSSKFTSEFWDSLWMAGYIDYNLHTEVENKLIVVSYQHYFETLDNIVNILTLPLAEIVQLGRYVLGTGVKKLFLTEFEISSIKQIEAKTLPALEIGSASSAVNALKLRNQFAAKQIADGHAFEKHIIQGKEFPGISTRQQFQEYLEQIMNSPKTLVKILSSGRTGFYDKISNTIIIYTPKAIDKGTAFKPKEGINYFLNSLN